MADPNAAPGYPTEAPAYPPTGGYPPQGGYPPPGGYQQPGYPAPQQGYQQPYPGQGYPPQGYPPQGYPAPAPAAAPIVINMTNNQTQNAGGVALVAPIYNRSTALWGSVLLSCCLQVHGFHYCYTGSVGLGLLSFITYGGCWIWTIIDWCRMDDIVDQANRRAAGVAVAIV